MNPQSWWLFGEQDPPEPAPGPRLPHAARLQDHVDQWDERLLAFARRQHPTVAWWWGKRRTDQGPGAWCYVCDTMIVTFALSWPMPARAREAVWAHRAGHVHALAEGGAP